MQNEPKLNFDDPVLKRAVRRAFEGERASDELRRRIADLATATSSVQHSRLALGMRSPLYGLAAAAILLLIVGVAISQYLGLFNSASSNSSAARFRSIADSMTVTHDACAKLPEHDLLDAGNDFAAIAASLLESLGRPVLAADLGDGWDFRGAGLCKVGRFSAGHLLFARGAQSVSVFSLPPISYEIQGDGNYELVASGHPVSGFATRRGLYCLVGYDPQGALSARDLSALRDKIRDEISAPAPAAPGACSLHPPAAADPP